MEVHHGEYTATNIRHGLHSIRAFRLGSHGSEDTVLELTPYRVNRLRNSPKNDREMEGLCFICDERVKQRKLESMASSATGNG
jgi:hypothetical protein